MSGKGHLLRPLTRLAGALRSGHPAARRSMVRTAVCPLARLLDRLLDMALPAPCVTDDNLLPCLMLVAPPRSGGTVLYQALTQTLPCVYPSNLHHLLPRTASHWMHRWGWFGQGIQGFTNYYGHTAALNDVNEANGWTDWVLDAPGGRAGVRGRFLRFVRALRPTPTMPLVWKNVGAYDRLPRLIDAVPELCFLRVRRDRRELVESELRGYHDLGTFNPVPASLRGRPVADPVAFAVEQIGAIDGELDRAQRLAAPGRWEEWGYEAFCERPWEHVEDLTRRRFPHLLSGLRRGPLARPLHRSRRQRVAGPDSERIARLLADSGRRVA